MIKNDVNKIMDVLNTIEYGYKDEEGKNIIDVNPEKWDNEFYTFYKLLSPQELMNCKCGVCWDQVELERELFKQQNIPFKTYFIFINDGKKLPSHTFLVYVDNNMFYWFEHSWFKYKGIHEYSSEKELLLDVKNKFCTQNNCNVSCDNVYIYEYQKPKEHITCNEFYEYIETQKLIKI